MMLFYASMNDNSDSLLGKNPYIRLLDFNAGMLSGVC